MQQSLPVLRPAVSAKLALSPLSVGMFMLLCVSLLVDWCQHLALLIFWCWLSPLAGCVHVSVSVGFLVTMCCGRVVKHNKPAWSDLHVAPFFLQRVHSQAPLLKEESRSVSIHVHSNCECVFVTLQSMIITVMIILFLFIPLHFGLLLGDWHIEFRIVQNHTLCKRWT